MSFRKETPKKIEIDTDREPEVELTLEQRQRIRKLTADMAKHFKETGIIPPDPSEKFNKEQAENDLYRAGIIRKELGL